VILGDQAEITDADRLSVENRQLQERIRELERQLEACRALEDSLQAVTRKLVRR
jgi:uncharacterized protein YigA (DUF484 family)